MNNFVISIGRELGSGGREIAEKLAARLGIKYYDKKLIEIAATESGIDASVFADADERESSTFMGNVFSIHGSITDMFMSDSCMGLDNLFALQSETIRDLSQQESCIIVGRCAEYVLREHPNMASIFITADYEERVKYICKNDNVKRERAIEIIEKGDKRRRQYHDYYTTTKWGVARCYDLCVNSSCLGIDGTVEFLYNYIKQRFAL